MKKPSRAWKDNALVGHKGDPLKNNTVNLFIKDKEKYDEDMLLIKKLFNRYESIGFRQVHAKEDKIRKLYNLVRGKINPEDYIGQEAPEGLQFNDKQVDLDSLGLQYYPIIPNINNGIVSEYMKKHIEYSAHASNPESTNQVIEAMNGELRQVLVQRAEQLFLADNPEPTEEQYKLFQESDKITKYYQTDYRLEIEKWANHTLEKENQKYNIKELEGRTVEQEITTQSPIVHVNLTDGNYKYEVWQEKDTFYLKSPTEDDLSQSMMVGNFTYSNVGSILNEYASVFKQDDIETIGKWVNTYYDAGFTIDGEEFGKTGNLTHQFESLQNWISFKNLERGPKERYGDFDVDGNQLIRKTMIYMLVPRKVGYLYFKDGDVDFKEEVDDQFKVTSKPIYRKGEEKSRHSLISGEHVDWFYKNELWRGIKLDVNLNSPNYNNTQSTEYESIWLELGKHEVQYSEENMRYGIRIPVHGGPTTDYYNSTISLVEMCSTWQILYNWIWNRNFTLLSTEVGKFLALNQTAIPTESMGESWEKNDLVKWALTGRDVGLAPIERSLSAIGQDMTGGVGQVIDLNKTQDILEKANLAALVKKECLAQVGLTEEYLIGNISPRQSGTSVAQGMQRSSNQIQHIYTRVNDVWKRARATGLETAQYLEAQNPMAQVSYLTNDQTRVIFRMNTDGFLLHKLEIHMRSNVADDHTLERIKTYMEQTNTLGANTLEMAAVQQAKSLPKMMTELRELDAEKKKEIREQREFEQQQQQANIEAKRQELEIMLAQKKESEALEREKDIMVAQIRSLGYAGADSDAVSKEIIELQNASMKQAEFYERLRDRDMMAALKNKEIESRDSGTAESNRLKEQMGLKQLEQKDRELDIREKEVIASNKRTKVLK